MARWSARSLASVLGNVALATLWALFAVVHLSALLQVFRLSLVLILVQEAMNSAFCLTRRRPSHFSHSPYEWAVAFAGTFCGLLFRPAERAHDLLVGDLVMSLGILLSWLGLLSLRRSIGMVPAHRGIQTRGLYRWVRHPLYLAYTLTHLGYLISNPTWHNVGVASVAFLLQVLRVFNEERFLSRDPEYRAFMKTTRWQLIPYVL